MVPPTKSPTFPVNDMSGVSPSEVRMILCVGKKIKKNTKTQIPTKTTNIDKILKDEVIYLVRTSILSTNNGLIQSDFISVSKCVSNISAKRPRKTP